MATQYSPRSVTDGLILLYDAGNKKSISSTGDTVINDLSGNNNNGTLTNNYLWTANSGGTIIFDVIELGSGYIILNDNIILNSEDEWTMEFLFIPHESGASYQTRINLTQGASGTSFLKFEWHNRLFARNNTGGTFIFQSGFSPALTRHALNHIVFYNSGGTCQLRINNIEIDTTLTTTGNLYVKDLARSQSSYITADWKYAKIYNRKLTDEEITNNWTIANRRYGIS